MVKEFYGRRRNLSTMEFHCVCFYDVRIKYHQLLDEFWSVIAFTGSISVRKLVPGLFGSRRIAVQLFRK